MDIFSSSHDGPIFHEGGILFKVQYRKHADEDRLDDVKRGTKSDEDGLSARESSDRLSTSEAFDILFGIKPNMTPEELEYSKQMREMLHASHRKASGSHRQNKAVSGAPESFKRKRSSSQPPDGHLDDSTKATEGCGAAALEH